MDSHTRDGLLRIGGLSDALFAIVLTLLVLELRLPEGGLGDASTFVASLVELWPRLFGYVLTFLVTGVYWVAHHRMFTHIERYDRNLLWHNLMFLLCVGLLPFPTALLGEHAARYTWALYALNMIAIGLTMTATWGYARSQGMVDAGGAPDDLRYLTLRSLVVPAAFAVSLVVLPASLNAAMFVPLVLLPLQALLQRRIGPEDDERPAARGRRALGWRLLGWTPVWLFGAWMVWALAFYRPAG